MFFEPDLTPIQTLHPLREFHHWCPKSEKFATTSHLFSAVRQGWVVNSLVIQRIFELRSDRTTRVYYVELQRNRAYMTMPVVENPSLIRLISLNPFEVVDYEQYNVMFAGKNQRRVARVG
jgi:hypothetical protein